MLDSCGVVYNGIDIKRWKFYEEGRQDDYAVWLGRIHPDKGLEYAIEATRLANIHLKIAGGIADKKYYADKIKPLLTGNVEMLGLLNYEDLNHLIGQAKVCLVTPVWQEPFGLVVAEAIACWTPVAGFAMGALPEIIDREVGCLVPFGEVVQLSKAIIEATGLNRVNVRAYCEQKFNIDKMMDQYEEILKKHTHSKPGITT